MTAQHQASAPAAEELVVLLDENLQPCGTAPKRSVHHRFTPLHLAFSCWVLDESGQRTLLSRRAETKLTFPSLWTNTFCGHPGPAESLEAAIVRRADDELNTRVADVASVLPQFRYRARMADGTMENEFCPVFTARLSADVRPDADEVAELEWVALADLSDLLTSQPDQYSPWLREQWPQLMTRLAAAIRAGERPGTP